MVRVTLDTNVFPADDLIAAVGGRGYALARVSVTDRELETSDLGIHNKSVQAVPETAVFGESRFGQAVFASPEGPDILEQALRVISNGSFPRDRSHLSEGELRQLRDAMILEAHIRSGADLFVTNDLRAFICGGRRAALEATLSVSILSRDEFVAQLSAD